MEKKIRLAIEGLGIVCYSPKSVAHIREHEDYFSSHYNNSEQILKHIMEGSIVGFSTGSSGTFILNILSGYPTKSVIDAHEFKIRLGIKVRDERVIFRDLYDLMDWRSIVPPHQTLQMANGYYHLSLCTNVPKSELLGDDQEVLVYFQPLDAMPELQYHSVPILCE